MKRRYRKPFTAKFLRSILRYEPLTGKWFWKISPTPYIKIGVEAGSKNTSGYCAIGIRRQPYTMGRLAWLYMMGCWPTHDIDHKDGNPSNNRWINLRQATNVQNGWNKKVSIYKKHTKLKGAFSVGRRYRALIGRNYKVEHLGTFDTAEEAHAAYMKAAKKYFGEFARG